MKRRNFLQTLGLSTSAFVLLQNNDSYASPDKVPIHSKIYAPEPILLKSFDSKYAWFDCKLIELGYYAKQNIMIDKDFVFGLRNKFYTSKDISISKIPVLIENTYSILDYKVGCLTKLKYKYNNDGELMDAAVFAELRTPLWLLHVMEGSPMPALTPIINRETKELTAVSLDKIR